LLFAPFVLLSLRRGPCHSCERVREFEGESQDRAKPSPSQACESESELTLLKPARLPGPCVVVVGECQSARAARQAKQHKERARALAASPR